jgi:RecA-family ATPase
MRANGLAEASATPLRPLNAAALQSLPVPSLRFLAHEWVPFGKPVLLAGRGGGGKTTITMQLAVARALGLPFLGLPVEAGGTLALLCEEAPDDAHRLLAGLAMHYARELRELAAVHYLARSGEDNALVWRSRNGEVQPTPLYEALREAIGDLKPSLLILDNARHVARVNENDGSDVTAAWSLLHGLMTPTGGTTLLCGHTPKNGTAEFAGNAAWENVARARLYLGPVEAEPGEATVENDPRRILRRGKSNANGTASLDLVWCRGAFQRVDPSAGTFGDHLDREMRRGQARQVFLDALDQLAVQGRNVSHSPAARNFAARVIKDASMAQEFTKQELERAMSDLLADGRIRANQPLGWSKTRNQLVGLARVRP